MICQTRALQQIGNMMDLDEELYLLTQRGDNGRAGVCLRGGGGGGGVGLPGGGCHHQTALDTPTELAAPVAGDEENVPAELDVVSLAVPGCLL